MTVAVREYMRNKGKHIVLSTIYAEHICFVFLEMNRYGLCLYVKQVFF